MTRAAGPDTVFDFIIALHPTNDVHLTECRWYRGNGFMVHYSIADQGTWRDVIAFVEHVGDRGGLGLRWSHDLTRQPAGPQPLENVLGATENVGSCEPDPLIIRWDKTQTTWHTDIDKVGRYSVQRRKGTQQFKAYLNGKEIAGDQYLGRVDSVKRAIELRIREAKRIAEKV